MDILATKVQPLSIHLGFPVVSLLRLTLGISVGVDSFLSASVEEEEYWGLLESNSGDLWLSSAVDSSSGVITVAMSTNLWRIHRDMRTWWSWGPTAVWLLSKAQGGLGRRVSAVVFLMVKEGKDLVIMKSQGGLH